MASIISSSDTSFEPDSTMLIASLVPATDKLMSLFSNSSTLGLMINLSSICPTTTPATGPSNGISLIDKHNDEPNNAVISGVQSCSTERTVFITCTSLRNPSLNNGRIGRSINLAARIACSVGLPSLLINPPGIFPTE